MRPVLAATLLAAASAAHAAETVRIAMGERPEREVVIHGKGLQLGPDSEDGPFQPLDRDEVRIRHVGDSMEVEGQRVNGPVRFRTSDADHWIRAGTTDVRGEVVALPKGSKVLLVNVLPMEDYVAAVLGGEMPVSFPTEALKAQAVAARTYALQRKIEVLGQPVHLGSSVLAQVYGGVNRENPRTRAAAAATAGQILTFQLAPIEAYFHASCEGSTETGLDALSRDLPYLQSVACECRPGASTRWKADLDAAALERAFGGRGELRVAARTGTGRVRRLELGGRSLSGVEFRQRLGYDRVRSLAFDVSPTPGGGARLTGRGLGHGAGLSQWGAKEMADAGQDYRAILAHFYPGTELQTLY
ncbi:MAG: SpoIID/LytB domain-containing protein [Myxococcaceae bacterium]|nr:MAG: SpoIID/LytB domain-containing protein [Myxococcaceae bacterium]